MRLIYDHVSGLFATNEDIVFETPINPLQYGYDDSPFESTFDMARGCMVWRIVVPRGELTDFASVPRLFWPIIPKMGRHSRAALLHDYLYRTHRAGRPWADMVFYQKMRDDETSLIVCTICYWAVRIFGRKAWN